MPPDHPLLAPLRRLHAQIRHRVVTACESTAADELAGVAAEAADDTIYAVDRVSEAALLDFFAWFHALLPGA